MKQAAMMASRRSPGAGARYLAVDDGRLAYLDEGSGPPLIFIHGWPLNKETFGPLIARLKQSFRCIAFDLLDIGDSRPVASGVPLSFPRHAACILDALDELDVDRFFLVGQDSGGLIARMMASQRPGRVSQLILFNTELPNHIPPWLRLFQALAKFPSIAKLTFRTSLRSRILAQSPMAFGGCFQDKAKIFGDFFQNCAVPLIADDNKLSGALRFLDQMDWSTRFEIEAMHKKIEAKTHFLWGDNDKFFPLHLARAAFDQFRNRGEFVVIENTRLLPYYEKPDLVSVHMLRILAAA
jgi:pimeloyl-ACP methyl ester carboxylesterase